MEHLKSRLVEENMKIPMVDLKGQYNLIKAEIDSEVIKSLESSQYILGPNVTNLELELGKYLNCENVVTLASGTDALHLALLASGVGEGDEVITSPFTFIATAEAIKYVGATPVFVDIDEKTYNLDPSLVEKAITKKTKAIIPVHLFGQPADINEFVKICEKHNLVLIEDCAQSFGASVDGKMTGTFGKVGCFSFFPSKNLGCYGDGGMVTCATKEIAEQVKVLRNHGSKVRYHHSDIGFNSRLDDIQAAILRVKLKRIDSFNENRRRVAKAYSEGLKDFVVTPFEDKKGVHVYHQYTILSEKRDKIMEHLTKKEIASAVYYPIVLHKQEVFAKDFNSISLPVSEKIAASCMSLPIYPEMTAEQIEYVVSSVKEVF